MEKIIDRVKKQLQEKGFSSTISGDKLVIEVAARGKPSTAVTTADIARVMEDLYKKFGGKYTFSDTVTAALKDAVMKEKVGKIFSKIESTFPRKGRRFFFMDGMLEPYDLIACIRFQLGLKSKKANTAALNRVKVVLNGKPDPMFKKHGTAMANATERGAKLWKVFITNGHYDSQGYVFAPTRKEAITLAKDNVPFDSDDDDARLDVEITRIPSWAELYVDELDIAAKAAKNRKRVYFDSYGS